jgi:hypothetical protein
MNILHKFKEIYLEGKVSNFFMVISLLSVFLLILDVFLFELIDTEKYFFVPFIMGFLAIIFSIGTSQGSDKNDFSKSYSDRKDMKLLGSDYNIPNDPFDLYWNDSK